MHLARQRFALTIGHVSLSSDVPIVVIRPFGADALPWAECAREIAEEDHVHSLHSQRRSSNTGPWSLWPVPAGAETSKLARKL